MIAVDTSALMAIVLEEAQAEQCKAILDTETDVIISAGTVAEALIVSEHRNVSDMMEHLIDGLGIEIVPLTPAAARRIASAYRNWGKGVHPAALNFGDCMAYEVAMQHRCPLLFVGDDFSKTDIESAL